MTQLPTFEIGKATADWAKKNHLEVEYFIDTTSTNDLAKAFEYTSNQPKLFVTENQSAGRGRNANTWINAKPGTCLLSSWSLQLSQPPQPITTPLVGLSLYRAARASLGTQNLSLKAPNDLYLGSKKLGGLLVEAVSQGNQHRLIVGLGLNIFDRPDIEVATSLIETLKNPLSKESFERFLTNFYNELTLHLRDFSKPELSPNSRAEILEALNKFPLLKEKYLSLEANGSLKTKTHQIHWMDL